MHESYLFKRNMKRSQKKIKKIQKTEGKKACKRGKTGHIERIRNKNKILRKKLLNRGSWKTVKQCLQNDEGQ